MKVNAFAKVGVSCPNTGKGGSLSAVNEVVSMALGLSQPSKVLRSGYQSATEVWTVHRGLSRYPLLCQFRSLFHLNLPSLLSVPLASASSHPLLAWGRAHIDPFRLLNFNEKHWLQLPCVYHCWDRMHFSGSGRKNEILLPKSPVAFSKPPDKAYGLTIGQNI